jgi:hypothetical protein
MRVWPGYLESYDGQSYDYVAWRASLYYYYYDVWESTPWGGYFYVDPFTRIILNVLDLGVGGGYWTAAVIEKYWYYGGQYEYYWLVPYTYGVFGNPTSGYYCWWG